jgi:hypothetical protein
LHQFAKLGGLAIGGVAVEALQIPRKMMPGACWSLRTRGRYARERNIGWRCCRSRGRWWARLA